MAAAAVTLQAMSRSAFLSSTAAPDGGVVGRPREKVSAHQAKVSMVGEYCASVGVRSGGSGVRLRDELVGLFHPLKANFGDGYNFPGRKRSSRLKADSPSPSVSTAKGPFKGGGKISSIVAKHSTNDSVMQSRQDLTGKNVVVVGLGVSGRAAVKLALARGANVVAVDSNRNTPPVEVDLPPALTRRLRVEYGPHNRETLLGASQLVLSPGVSASQPDIAEAIQAGVPALSELSFAAAALPKSIQVAAVTGTNGKSTVTTFAGQILRHSGVRTFVGGNLGTPLSEAAFQCLAFPANDPPYHAAVIEVSSYQMECAGMFRPKVGVILNLTPDHLERHKTMEIYGKVKCRIFAQMGPTDLAVIPQSDPFLRKLAAESRSKGTRAWLGGLPGVQLDSQARRAFILVPTTGVQAGLYLSSVKAVGLHNAHNSGSAALIALALDLGLTEESIQAALPSLQPPPHRMEVVHQDDQQILWVNDSKATNVDATLVGMKGIVGRKAVVLLGGLAKVGCEGNLGFERLVEVMNSHRAVILFGASGEQIEEELRVAEIAVPCVRARHLKDAVKLARSLVQPGNHLLHNLLDDDVSSSDVVGVLVSRSPGTAEKFNVWVS